MQISISSIKGQQGLALPFDFSISKAELGPMAAEAVLLEPVVVQGTVTNTGSFMLVRAKAKARVELPCSRCLQPFQVDVDADIEERFRPREDESMSDAEDGLAEEEDVGYYERDRIDIGEVVRENFALEIPMKPVCNEACQGLCPQCGINLNEDTCTCSPDDTDPRLAVLREWKARHAPSD